MDRHTLGRLVTLTLVALMLSTAVVGVSAGVAVADDHNGNETVTDTPGEPGETDASDDGDGNETVEDEVDEDSTVRLIPVRDSQDWSSVEQQDRGEFLTTGPVFYFEATSGSVTHAEVREPGAQATVMGGGSMIQVEFDEDASGVGEDATLFTMEVIKDDGSSGLVDLHAQNTGVSVGASELEEYRGVIEMLKNDAEERGFDADPSGVRDRYDGLLETEEHFESFYTQEAIEAALTLWMWVTNPMGLIATVGGLGLLSMWLYKRHRETLQIVSEDPGRTSRRKSELRLSFVEHQRTAADERLREIDVVGVTGELNWSALGVRTTHQLCELFDQGIEVEQPDGSTRRVGGIDEIDPDNIEDSWLEIVCRPGRYPSEEIALAQARAVLHRAITEHNQPMYRDTYQDVDALLSHVDQRSDLPGGSGAVTGVSA